MSTEEILFPEIEPYDHGFLPVGNGHEVYYEQCGNPKGEPIMVVHGGPGAGCWPTDRRFFDPEKWRIILFDQRGSNRSKPFCKIYANNTWALVDDMKLILRSLNVEKTALFGGSWGSTLSLVYPITYPRTVTGIILRGIFLGEKSECDYLYQGEVKNFAPREWERFIRNVPEKERYDVLEYFYRTMTGGDPETRKKLAYEMAFFEESILRLVRPSDEDIEKELQDYPYESLGLLEAHYFVHGCFMEEGYILNNIRELPDVPISIIQGQYDLVCPPISAYRLCQALDGIGRNADLYPVVAGHTKSDIEITKKLVSETEALYAKIRTNR